MAIASLCASDQMRTLTPVCLARFWPKILWPLALQEHMMSSSSVNMVHLMDLKSA